MNITILGASGAIGREVTALALARGHQVIALVRKPESLRASVLLKVVRADVADSSSIQRGLEGAEVVISVLGLRKGDMPVTLTNAARLLSVSGVPRVVWLGSFGIGATRRAIGPVGPLLRFLLRREADEKAAADEQVAASGGSVVHSPGFSGKPATGQFRLVSVEAVRSRIFPPMIPRADVAALLLGEAETPQFAGRISVAQRAADMLAERSPAGTRAL